VFGSKDEKLVPEIFRAIDKIQKKRKDEIFREYEQKGFARDKLEKVLEFSAINGSPEEIEQKFDVKSLASWDQLKELYNSLKERDVTNIRINFGIVRGLDYYSDFVFEAYDTTSDLGSLVGGGRYDTLPQAFGRNDLGATGVAGGIARIIYSMDKQGVSIQETQTAVHVLYVNDDMQNPAAILASDLRKRGIPCVIDLAGKPLKKQMEAASEAKFTIIFGPKEFEDGAVIIRNMDSGNEVNVKIMDLIADPKSYL